MDITITGTNERETLRLECVDTQICYVQDYIGNTGALNDGQFTYNDDDNTYHCDRDTFNWWEKRINDQQALDVRIHNLRLQHGTEAVEDALSKGRGVPFEYEIDEFNALLDEAFGEE